MKSTFEKKEFSIIFKKLSLKTIQPPMLIQQYNKTIQPPTVNSYVWTNSFIDTHCTTV